MSKLLSIALFVIVAATVVNGSTWLMPIEADPKHPGKCVYQGQVFDVGVTVQDPDSCGRITCRWWEGENGFILDGAGCGSASFGDLPAGKCLVDAEPHADYPGCCKKKVVDCPVP